jgi:hypothetical protein
MSHTNGTDCPCGPKVKAIPGSEIILHRPLTTTTTVKRRKIAGLPMGWVIVGRNPSSDVMTEAQRVSAIEATEGAERRRQQAARKEANQRQKRGMA